jgi:hypothetical protein
VYRTEENFSDKHVTFRNSAKLRPPEARERAAETQKPESMMRTETKWKFTCQGLAPVDIREEGIFGLFIEQKYPLMK